MSVYFPIKAFPGCYGVPTAKMSRAQWEAARNDAARYGVGGSEIGTLMPNSDRRFTSPIRMYYERIGLWQSNYRDSKYAFMGRMLEKEIVQLWKHWSGDWESTMANVAAGKTSRKSVACNYIIKNPEYLFLFANIDHRIVHSPDAPKKRGILECKTMSGHASDRYETGIPPKYVVQIQQYMLVTGQDYAELAVLMDGVDFEVYPLQANTTIQNKIVEVSEDFFKRVMDAKEELRKLPKDASYEMKMQVASAFEPPVADGDDEYDFLSEKAKMRLSATITEPDAEIKAWHTKVKAALEQQKTHEAEVQGFKNLIRQRMVNEGIYQYKWDEGVITNGQRFIIK